MRPWSLGLVFKLRVVSIRRLVSKTNPSGRLRPFPSIIAEKRFADPIGLESDILLTIESLSHELQNRLEQRGEGARRIQLILFRADGKVIRLDVGTAAPLRDPARIRRLFSDRLAVLGDEYDPGFGFDMIRLAVQASERLDAKQGASQIPIMQTISLISSTGSAPGSVSQASAVLRFRTRIFQNSRRWPFPLMHAFRRNP